MKYISLAAASSLALSLVSCDFNTPLPNNGYDPLDGPGANGQFGIVEPQGPSYLAGSFLQTTSPMTAFYSRFPSAMDQPDKTLPARVDVKVISTKGSYVKVEVVNTGDVGYVPSVMLGEKRSANEVPVTGTPRDVQGGPSVVTPPEDLNIVAPGMRDPSLPAE